MENKTLESKANSKGFPHPTELAKQLDSIAKLKEELKQVKYSRDFVVQESIKQEAFYQRLIRHFLDELDALCNNNDICPECQEALNP